MSDPTIRPLQAANERLSESNLAALHERAEEINRQTARRQHAFLSKLAHDLRNPLAPIHNSLEILKLLDHGNADALRAIEIIDGQVRNLRRLLNDVLDFSRIVCDRIELKMQRVVLADVVAQAAAGIDSLMVRRHHQLAISLPGEPVWIMGDPARLTQVFASLLENAAQFTADHGQIRLVAAAEDAAVICRVVDNGIGMDAKVLSSVFDLFAHAERSLDEARPGLGIGLTVVRKLVEMHGGSVQALSEGPGRGSEFVVRLPRLAHAEFRKTGPLGTEDGPAKQPTRRILIVSNLQFAEELDMFLRLAGHETQTAHDATEALEMAQQFQPHVIAIDLDMAGFKADEFGRRLRTLPGLEKAMLIANSGTASEQSRQRAAAAGCQAHLTKPVKIRDLLRLIAEKDALAGS
jgi:CheY-like chemotaxis protein/nitrogen-specific signal transduction histidine kinase